ncbi:hypothetical protein PY254_08820 [Rhodanobacter sp. AS-Z3]|uniref:hypothetical protein n=1 Tax=Rhodanobacter sp. AS-Z3 TaxID=3031330 RepID=UPI002478EAA1|nr:hypothetical protein [Rhodanobacter sp. AS-Z3]WEN16752.1 hypothetical protein PY254_08820 [Rhodanobacter sp. AS-Z3]
MSRRFGIWRGALLLVSACAIASMAHADSGNTCSAAATEAILTQMQPLAPANRKVDASRMICKAWPGQTDTLLATVPLMQELDVVDDNTGDLEILVLDQPTLQVRQRLLLPDQMSDDAVRIDQLIFDTAPYQLAAGVRAFGLRIQRIGSSRVNPYGETELQLFVIRHGQLARILDGLLTSQDGGEWDGDCTGNFHSTSRSLSMQAAVHHGYRDITVNSSSTSSNSSLDSHGDCTSGPETLSHDRQQLQYNGTHYVVPAALKL